MTDLDKQHPWDWVSILFIHSTHHLGVGLLQQSARLLSLQG
jgi:hypothetical protein